MIHFSTYFFPPFFPFLCLCKLWASALCCRRILNTANSNKMMLETFMVLVWCFVWDSRSVEALKWIVLKDKINVHFWAAHTSTMYLYYKVRVFTQSYNILAKMVFARSFFLLQEPSKNQPINQSKQNETIF